MLKAHNRIKTSCWVITSMSLLMFTASIATVDVMEDCDFLCFPCSIGASPFFHNHAPEPLPAVHRCIHRASRVGVCQGGFTSNVHFSKAGSLLQSFPRDLNKG